MLDEHGRVGTSAGTARPIGRGLAILVRHPSRTPLGRTPYADRRRLGSHSSEACRCVDENCEVDESDRMRGIARATSFFSRHSHPPLASLAILAGRLMMKLERAAARTRIRR